MPHHNTDHTWEIYKCGSYCGAINSNTTCTRFTDDILTECLSAQAHCDCRPAWKQPVVWIVAGSFAFAFVLMVRDFIVRIMNRHARIGRRTVVAQPIVSTISVGFQSNYGMSHGMPQPVVAAPMPQMPSQWNPAPTESQPPPYSYPHPI